MVEVRLTQGYVATIDDEDAALVKQHRWRVLIQPHTAYAIARLPRVDGKQRTLYMHRLVTNAKAGEKVLHIDRNGRQGNDPTPVFRLVALVKLGIVRARPSARKRSNRVSTLVR